MQGSALIVVAPLIVAYFVGIGMLLHAGVRARFVPTAAVWLGRAALPVLASVALLPDHGRLVGLVSLGCISAVQVWTGYGLFTTQRVHSLESAAAHA
jgi:hypothetical protein